MAEKRKLGDDEEQENLKISNVLSKKNKNIDGEENAIVETVQKESGDIEGTAKEVTKNEEVIEEQPKADGSRELLCDDNKKLEEKEKKTFVTEKEQTNEELKTELCVIEKGTQDEQDRDSSHINIPDVGDAVNSAISKRKLNSDEDDIDLPTAKKTKQSIISIDFDEGSNSALQVDNEKEIADPKTDNYDGKTSPINSGKLLISLPSEDVQHSADEGTVNNEEVQDQPQEKVKKKRRRLRAIINKIQAQLEFYFSRANIKKDVFMKSLLQKSPYISLTSFLNCKKVKELTTEVKLLQYAVNNSSILKLSSDKSSVYSTQDTSPKLNELDCTIYVDRLQKHHTTDWIRKHFSKYGPIEYLTHPKHKSTGLPKGFAFIEYDSPESAKNALVAYGAVMDPLLSINANDPLNVKYLGKRLDGSNAAEFKFVNMDHDGSGVETNDAAGQLPSHSCEGIEGDGAKSKGDVNKSPSPLKDNKDPHKIEGTPPTEDSKLNEETANENEAAKIDESNEELSSPKKKRKKLHRKNRLKMKQKKLAIEMKETELIPPVRFTVMSKRSWLMVRKEYLDNQKTVLSTCKNIMKKHREQQDALKIDFGNSQPNSSKQKPQKVIGVIVKIVLDNPLEDKVQMKDLVNRSGKDIAYIDLKKGNKNIYVRFRTPEAAQLFLRESIWKNRSSLLFWEEEDKYWDKIFESYDQMILCTAQNKKKCRKRGKQKVLSRWHKFVNEVDEEWTEGIASPTREESEDH